MRREKSGNDRTRDKRDCHTYDCGQHCMVRKLFQVIMLDLFCDQRKRRERRRGGRRGRRRVRLFHFLCFGSQCSSEVKVSEAVEKERCERSLPSLPSAEREGEENEREREETKPHTFFSFLLFSFLLSFKHKKERIQKIGFISNDPYFKK